MKLTKPRSNFGI